jgi:hypothetical protein
MTLVKGFIALGTAPPTQGGEYERFWPECIVEGLRTGFGRVSVSPGAVAVGLVLSAGNLKEFIRSPFDAFLPPSDGLSPRGGVCSAETVPGRLLLGLNGIGCEVSGSAGGVVASYNGEGFLGDGSTPKLGGRLLGGYCRLALRVCDLPGRCLVGDGRRDVDFELLNGSRPSLFMDMIDSDRPCAWPPALPPLGVGGGPMSVTEAFCEWFPA